VAFSRSHGVDALINVPCRSVAREAPESSVFGKFRTLAALAIGRGARGKREDES
jgi:hypothetical protein